MKAKRFSTVLGVVFSAQVVCGAQEYRMTILHPQGFDRSEAAAGSAGQQAGLVVGSSTNSRPHAALWTGSSRSYVDLHPTGYLESLVWGVSGNTQVGIGQAIVDSRTHALMWIGTAASVVDLHPTEFDESFAKDTFGNQQVGYANAPQRQHAILWNGAADDYVDLHPAGFFQSIALGIYGDKQVGYGDDQALLWSGSAERVVNLHPSSYDRSRANDVSATHAVGYAAKGSIGHAILWSLDSAEAVSLHPQGYSYSWGWGTAGDWQVGYGDSDTPEPGGEHALVWRGSAESVVDLHNFVPQRYSTSVAYGVDSAGTVYGTIAAGDPFHDAIAVMWTPVPEPTSMCLLLMGSLFLTRFKEKSIGISVYRASSWCSGDQRR